MNILLMAQGQQRRLPDLKHPKHLLAVGGEPILVRTLRMLRDSTPGPWTRMDKDSVTIVGNASDFSRATVAAGLEGLVDIIPNNEPGACIVDGMIASRASWGYDLGRTLILLGDVVWSWAALEQVLADKRPIVFAGTPVLTAAEGEVFALAFDDPEELHRLCITCPCRVDGSRARSFMKAQGGHMRRLLWWTQECKKLRLPARSKQTWHPDVYLPIEDWTDDVDTPADVARLPELARLAELDERQRAARAAV